MGRLLALDVGDRRIGVALSDPMHIIASPHSVIDRKITPDYMREIKKLILEQEVEALVVGLPLTLKNRISQQTEKVQLIIEELTSKLTVPIHKIDERLSSVSAQNALKLKGVKTGHNKGEIDKTAAAIFLQEFLDSK
ncbi:MAG: Holliday junction resolvase RuvX [Candidatus Marinimicrobia bacterium]|nr:Holliday junction resolvase RuvX [Candidatus Neomarinimicrobiota bacterium]MBT5955592.1 Holliday junction resolvase RuvX [Candidatus Neomarinimicrobiota bacterium]MBT6871507.1 Holliday junction resolvase RuvX [Candidatus Neomarinimicrobiota bacterium]